MILIVALITVLIVAYRLRAGSSAKLAGDVDLETEDPCPELDDSEIWSMGFASRAEFRDAEIRHFEESAREGRSVSESEWRRYHGLPLQQPTPKTGLSVRRIMRQCSRSRRAPRRSASPLPAPFA